MDIYVWIVAGLIAFSYVISQYDTTQEKMLLILFYGLAGVIVSLVVPKVPQDAGVVVSVYAPLIGHVIAHKLNMHNRRRLIGEFRSGKTT